jgi:hypothetical protein
LLIARADCETTRHDDNNKKIDTDVIDDRDYNNKKMDLIFHAFSAFYFSHKPIIIKNNGSF